MPKDLVALYEAILRDAQGALALPDRDTTRSRLYTLLLRTPLDPALEQVLRTHGVSASYTRTHLLSIGSWPPKVQRAMRRGLPYQDARRVAQLEHDDQETVLRAFYSGLKRPSTSGTAAARVRERELAHRAAANAVHLDAKGWALPSSEPAKGPRRVHATEVFHDTEVHALDALPQGLMERLIVSYTAPSQRVVDPMAGHGTVAIVGSALGRRVWSGDLVPRYDFIHPIDAGDPDQMGHAAATADLEADLVVLHPPVLEEWCPNPGPPDAEAYEAWVSRLIEVGAPLVRSSGHLVVIVRPHRGSSGIWPHVGRMAACMAAASGRLVGYHVAVEVHGEGDWHALVSVH